MCTPALACACVRANGFPVDGVVVEGTSAIDPSQMITGEPIPVEETPGDQVTGGTVNGTGGFVMRAEHVGSETLLAQIVRLVGGGRSGAVLRSSGSPTLSLRGSCPRSFWSRRRHGVVVWGSVGPEPRLAHALVNAVAVLIIACPCQLSVFATPMSIMVRPPDEGPMPGSSSGTPKRSSDSRR